MDRSKYLKEVILKIKLLYKSLLCIFNFVGPGYFTITQPLSIRNYFLYILIISDIKYPGLIPYTLYLVGTFCKLFLEFDRYLLSRD